MRAQPTSDLQCRVGLCGLQMLQELMHQMQASTEGFAARFPNGSFPIPSLDASQPNIGQWRQ